MDPAPAPLVYINGWPGVGKEAVAECLTLLLGRDKSLLVDIRSVGHGHDNNNNKNGHGHHQLLPLTPEHPSYFDFDPSNSTSSSSTYHPPSPPAATGTSPVCSTSPGRAAIRTFQTAASVASRLFITVTLTCEPAEHMRRAQSLQRQCSYKTRSIDRTTARAAAAATAVRAGGSGSGSGSVGYHQTTLARPLGRDEVLTVDVTTSSAFETALKIVDFINKLVVERDTELCSSAVTTPLECAGSEWKQLGAR
ncbi:hypothetical protein B0T17DRAFT_638334 [Bombardia bombarda]|uniref:Uncharacterized protein n=1 Tax=Bombardia bombarda TaxID=252184 RepID=A0AA39WZR6_9PEZI|nr:hypothetical protein B0T17DRAFT_638334 [Bombardia bombarda]